MRDRLHTMPERTPKPQTPLNTPAEIQSNTGQDSRLPYEPPALLKKRSVAGATLGTPMGPSSVAMLGN